MGTQMTTTVRYLLCALLAIFCCCGPLADVLPVVTADASLVGIACRSVHLHYPGAEGQAFYNEVTVEQSAPGTYFCACGFHRGYFGIQELSNGKKVVLFSVWDSSNQNDPARVPEERRVKVLHQAEQ